MSIVTCYRSLSEISPKAVAKSALWMAIWYGVWIAIAGINTDYNRTGLFAVVLGFLPVLLWSVYDYRFGLILTILATPLLRTPVIPHGFTQGFGDLCAICTIAGFFLRHLADGSWRELWRREYIWLVLILLAAAVSLVGTPYIGVEARYGIKYGFAEMLGYCLVFLYMAILVHNIRSRADAKTVVFAMVSACAIVALYSAAGTIMYILCTGGFYVGATGLTANQSLYSTFGSPNYHAAYVVTAFPLIALFYLSRIGKVRKFFVGVAVILWVFFVQASMSRAALVVLAFLVAGWVLSSRFRPGTRLLSVILIGMIPLTYVVWWYPACTCPDTLPEACPYREPAKNPGKKQAGMGEVLTNIDISKTTKGEGGWYDKTRGSLLVTAFHVWLNNPWTGVGAGLMANHQTESGYTNRAHNMVLTIAAEQGILGIMAWGGLVWTLIATLRLHKPKENDDAYNALVLSFVATILLSLFMDFYRMLWIWQMNALIFSWEAMKKSQTGSDA